MTRTTICVAAFLALGCVAPVSADEPDPSAPGSTAAAATVAPTLAEPEATPPAPAKSGAAANTYLIEAQLIGTTPAGKPSVLSSPAMMVLEGKPATVEVGSQIPMLINDAEGQKKVEQVFSGLSLTAKVYCSEDGQTLVDAKIMRSWPLPTPGPGGVLQMANTRASLTTTVTLGSKVVVPLWREGEEAATDRFEFTVSEPTAKTASPPQNQPVQR